MRRRLEIDAQEVPITSVPDLERTLASAVRGAAREITLARVTTLKSTRFQRFVYKALGLRLPEAEEHGAVQVSLSGDLASVMFLRSDDDAGLVAIGNTKVAGNSVSFLTAHGEPFSEDRSRCVQVDAALAALLEFYQTGRRPKCVSWVPANE